jgi:hypothetical protein
VQRRKTRLPIKLLSADILRYAQIDEVWGTIVSIVIREL